MSMLVVWNKLPEDVRDHMSEEQIKEVLNAWRS